MMSRKILFIFLVLMALPLVASFDDTVKQGDSVDIRVTPTANATIGSVLTNITIKDPDGVVIVAFRVMQKNLGSQDFNYSIPGSNTSKIGIYDCTFYAFSSIAENKAFSCEFEVNQSGKKYIPEISGPLVFGAILALMFTAGFLFVIGFKMDLVPMKVFFIIMAGIVTIMNLGFVTASFQEFFSPDSGLSGAFGTLYIIFGLLLAASGVFLMIWGFLVGLELYKIKRGFFIDTE